MSALWGWVSAELGRGPTGTAWMGLASVPASALSVLSPFRLLQFPSMDSVRSAQQSG